MFFSQVPESQKVTSDKGDDRLNGLCFWLRIGLNAGTSLSRQYRFWQPRINPPFNFMP